MGKGDGKGQALFGGKKKEAPPPAPAPAPVAEPAPAPVAAPAPAPSYGGTSEDFESANGYSWDLVMVFPTEDIAPTEPRDDGKPRRTWQYMLNQFNAAGLETFAYLSIQKDEVYIKIRASLDRLMQQADLVNWKMELDPATLEAVATKGFPKFGIKALELNPDKKYCKYAPYEHIYAKFDQDPELVVLYKKAPGLNHPFSGVQRVKLMCLIIESPKEQAGCGINIAKCIEVGDVLKFFPLHDPSAAKKLEKIYCCHQFPSNQPNDAFKVRAKTLAGLRCAGGEATRARPRVQTGSGTRASESVLENAHARKARPPARPKLAGTANLHAPAFSPSLRLRTTSVRKWRSFTCSCATTRRGAPTSRSRASRWRATCSSSGASTRCPSSSSPSSWRCGRCC